LLLPTPVAGAFNDGESAESWLARRERQKKLGRNGNGIGTPLAIAIRLLPTPLASDGAAERAPQLGGQRPSGAKRQIGLPEVIACHLTSPAGHSARPRARPGRSGCCPHLTPALLRAATAAAAAGPATATRAARAWTPRPGPSPLPGRSRALAGTRSPGGSTSRRSGGGNRSSATPPRCPPSPAPQGGPGCPPRSPNG
jgi:DNA (cytosine-5)-methyltransferase 1